MRCAPPTKRSTLNALCEAFDRPKFRAPIDARRTIALRLQQVLIDLIALETVGTLIEIGAHAAEFSRTIRNIFGEIACVAFEANPHVFGKFNDNVAASEVRYVMQAVGRTDGEADFHIPTQLGGRPLEKVNYISGLRQRNGPGCAYENVRVPLTRLDTFCAQHSIRGPYALWIDVEGAQIDVIEGATGALTDTNIVFIEVETHEFWSEQALENTLSARLAEMGFVPLLRDLEHPRQFNILLVRTAFAERHAERIMFVQQEFARLLKRMQKTKQEQWRARQKRNSAAAG